MADSIGKITGKTTTTEVKFKANGLVKKWDYVQVNHKAAGSILGQVTELERENNTIIATCTLIGYRNERNFLRLPRTPLEPDENIFPAEDVLIIKTIGLTKGGLYLGLLEGKPSIKTYVDPEKLLTKHLAVLAKSGAGKSYAVGVILEELAEKGFPTLVIDPHGEYSTMVNANQHADDEKYFKAYDIAAKGYKDRVKEFALNTQINTNALQLKLAIPNTPFELVESLPLKISNAQKGLLYSAINELKERKQTFDFADIVSYIDIAETNAKWGLISAIEALQKTNLFSTTPTDISEIVRPGQLTIVNLKGASPDLQEAAVSSLAIKLFEQRKMENVPPFFFVIEEAHSFCPERGFGEARSSKILRAIASEGRKFGLGLCVISQRPARIDKNVLSQCSSQIVLQVTNPNDLKAISNSFEGISAETESEIRSLPIGKALVIGCAEYPTFVDIRVRRSQHGGRAQKIIFESENDSDDEFTQKLNEHVEQKKTNGELMYAFRPRINKKDLIMLEENEIKESSLVLYPVLCVNGLKNGVELYTVFDLRSKSLFYLDDKLHSLTIPEQLVKLSPMQKKVLNGVTTLGGKTTSAELLIKTGMSFGEVEGVLASLAKANFVQIDVRTKGVKMSSLLMAFAQLQELNFTTRADYVDLPGEKLASTVDENEIINFVEQLGVQVQNKRVGFIPFWKVKFKGREDTDGKETEKLADALTWSFEV